MLGDFSGSINYTGDIESDIQFFLDSYANVSTILELPKCPFINEIRNYCFTRSFPNPRITTPLSADFPQVDSASGVNYNNNVSLALILTYTVLPSYARKPPASYVDAPSSETQKYQILRLGLSLVHAQDCFGGKINGVFYGV